jgi:hypothetical protein
LTLVAIHEYVDRFMLAKQPCGSHVDRFKMHPKAAVNSPLQEVEKGTRSALYLQELLYTRGFV